MTPNHTDEKKPADAGEIEALNRALEESPSFKVRLALHKLDFLLKTIDEGHLADRESEREAVRHGIFAAMGWLSEAGDKLFPEDRGNWRRTISTLHFDSVCAQYDTSD